MGNKFKFKLAGLLRLREFKEEKLKIEIGSLVRDEHLLRTKIKKIYSDIEEGYSSQSEMLLTTTKGKNAHFYPYYFQGKSADLERCETQLFSLEKKIAEKRKDLAEAMGEVKVIETLKEKELNKYHKEKNKLEQLDIEENMIMNFNKSEY